MGIARVAVLFCSAYDWRYEPVGGFTSHGDDRWPMQSLAIGSITPLSVASVMANERDGQNASLASGPGPNRGRYCSQASSRHAIDLRF